MQAAQVKNDVKPWLPSEASRIEAHTRDPVCGVSLDTYVADTRVVYIFHNQNVSRPIQRLKYTNTGSDGGLTHLKTLVLPLEA